MRIRSVSRLPLVLLAITPVLSAAEPALDRLVPADTAMVLALDDLPRLRSRFETSPGGRAWADPEVARFVAPLFMNSNYLGLIELIKTETGHTPAELLSFATGDVLLTVPVSSLRIGSDKGDIDALLAVEIGDNEARLRDLIALQQAKRAADASVVETTEDYNGVALHFVSPAAAAPAAPAVDDGMNAPAVPAPVAKPRKSLVWALHQGRWFVASQRDLVTGALDALAAGGLAESLSSSPGYRAVLDRSGGRPDYALWVDFKAIYPVLVAGIEAGRDPKQAPNPLGLEPLNIIKALGLDTLGALSAAGGFEDDGSARGDVALTYSEPRGIVNLLAYRDGPVARPDWVPATWLNVSTQNFSIPDLYAELERILDRISPMVAGMALGQVRAFDRQLKIDLKRDLVGNFGPVIVGGIALPAGASGATPPAYDEMDQFFAVSLADAAAFERTVDALKGRFLPPEGGPLQKRDYLGRAVYGFTPPAGAPAGTRGFHYAVADGWLLVGLGSPATVEAVLQRMNKPEPAASFWARADVRGALDATPAAACTVQFTDLPLLFSSMAALAVKMQQARGDEGAPFVDASAVPPAGVFARYFSHVVNHGERKADGFYFHTAMPAVAR